MTAVFRGGRKKPGRAYVKTARETILGHLETRTLTVRQAQRLCQRDYDTARRALRKLKADRLVHITEWLVHEVGQHEAVWALGDDKDEPNPAPMTSAEKCRRHRARHNPPSLAHADPLLAAMMGVGLRSGCRDSTMLECA